MRAAVRRLLPAFVLLAWMTPGAGALAVAVHWTLDHHGGQSGGRDQAMGDLARAVTHGHHHDVGAAPDHEHAARFGVGASAPQPGPSPAATHSSPPVAAAAPTAHQEAERPLRRGPPPALFAAHCALLL